ncbi:hypothetical protein H5410_049950 [Solanum commersonii]|uniref:Uncharacterized protein n=1 Tax=Solanum commersonii TaxID=4109 RepID=A0A9J5WTX6_SOLCO|nr:hypothetical protein H5410_049950 [Solanum commersonii]
MGGNEGICWWYVDTPVRMERRSDPWWFTEGSLMVWRKEDDSGEENEAEERKMMRVCDRDGDRGRSSGGATTIEGWSADHLSPKN